MYKTSGKGSAAKKTAWKNFARYIRLRDCLKTTGTTVWCICVTCGKRVCSPYLEAGHAIGQRTNGILFDESIVRGQCSVCNGHDGETQAFKAILVSEHGEAWYDFKVAARNSGTFYTDDDYRRISKEYRKKYNELKRRAE